MAVEAPFKSRLQLIFDDGTDLVSGKPIYKQKSFNNVKTAATADQLYAIAQAFAGLQQRPLYNIEREDSSEIRQA